MSAGDHLSEETCSLDDPLREEAAGPEADNSSVDEQLSPVGSPKAGSPIPVPPNAARKAGEAAGHPGDPMDAAVLNALIQRASPACSETRFSMSDIVRNPTLQKAARRELEGRASSISESELSSCLDGNGHEAEIERQRAVVTDLDRSVVGESKVNKGMANLVLERLEAGQKALEALCQLLKTLADSEQQQSNSLAAAAKLDLAGQEDGPLLQSAAALLRQVPGKMAAAHGQLHQELQQLLDPSQQLLGEYKAAAKSIKADASKVQKAVEDSRWQLSHCFLDHKVVCEAFDAAAADGGRVKVLQQDPWASEGRLVAEQRKLQQQQDKERAFLAEAFGRVQSLEARRVLLVQHDATALVDLYSKLLAPLPGLVGALAPSAAAAAADPAQELLELQRLAAETNLAAQKLAARQAAAVEEASQELFCSPEITRQGEMARWCPRTSEWEVRHFVLTRAGFLHCFTSMEDVTLLDMLRLSRCEFEQGKAPVFNLLESGVGSWLGRGSRKCTFKATSVEEYCEWAIALREAIAMASGRPPRRSSGFGAKS